MATTRSWAKSLTKNSLPIRSLAIKSLMAIAMAGTLAFGSGARAQTPTPAPPAENAAPTADNGIMLTIFLKHDQSRPLKRTQRATCKARLLQAIPADRHRSRELVRDDGDRTGRHDPASGIPAPRGQPDLREYRLGRLPHGILSDLRPQGDRPRTTRKGAGAMTVAPAYERLARSLQEIPVKILFESRLAYGPVDTGGLTLKPGIGSCVFRCPLPSGRRVLSVNTGCRWLGFLPASGVLKNELSSAALAIASRRFRFPWTP